MKLDFNRIMLNLETYNEDCEEKIARLEAALATHKAVVKAAEAIIDDMISGCEINNIVKVHGYIIADLQQALSALAEGKE